MDFGEPGASRTRDLWLRKPTLYPAELRAHKPRARVNLAHYRLFDNDSFSGGFVAYNSFLLYLVYFFYFFHDLF